MKDIELVVFDWDGTLMDSTTAIAESIQLAAADLGLPVPDYRAASHVIGLGLADALRTAVPALTEARLPEYLARYRVHFELRDRNLRAFDGSSELLAELRNLGVPVAVATGKSRQGLERGLDVTGWRPYFRTTRCANEGKPKPDPWMLREVCQTVGVDPQRCVMIGDTTHDLLMAQALGTWSIAVSYGAHPRDELQRVGAHAYCESIDELRRYLVPRLVSRAGLGERDGWMKVASADALVEGGDGIRFEWPARGGRRAAFVVRYDARPRAFLNECSHVPVELDWQPGRFFDDSGLYLVCATHGAAYSPETGSCQGGPCGRRGLKPLESEDQDGFVWVRLEAGDD